MSIGETITVLSANCQGLRDIKKRNDVLNYLKDKNPDIVCLQDTHWIDTDEPQIRQLWGNECVIHGLKTNSRGVAILFVKHFEYNIDHIEKFNDGNMISIDIKLSDLKLKIINLYGPNQDSPTFFQRLESIIESSKQDYLLVCGDFNVVLDPSKDSKNYIGINNPQSRNLLLRIINEKNLVDVYRHVHNNTRRFIWRRRNPFKQARLDFFLTNDTFLDILKHCDILPGYRSDHSIISLNVFINKFSRGKGIWKLNTNLLKNNEYVDLINAIIIEEKVKYAALVYNYNYISDPFSILQLRIDYDCFLEMLLLRIRGETVKFSSYNKKRNLKREICLIREIENLEKSPDLLACADIFLDKQQELEELRADKIKGHMVRSRVEWLAQGEKPSSYFCSLENKHFIEKTVNFFLKSDGTYVTEQKQILIELRKFYTSLFANRDTQLQDTDLNQLLSDYVTRTLDPTEAEELEGKITEPELNATLKNMKNNKTPGIDGFPAEFFKVFWSRLKYYILSAINTCYDKGILSLTLRQCIISCIPKGDKSRELLKNWRPISLLSVVYKLASASIANRIKTVLDTIIEKSQTGYISGRYIGESTRLIYDVMHYTEDMNIDGLLMLIDFEKAFDSLSWKFLYKVLKYVGFKDSIIAWVHLFNNEIQASVIQCGYLSEPFKICRGAKQGDPIAAYLYIICGEVLSILIRNNKSIKGIIMGEVEHKLTQFADDITLLLDGAGASLWAALNVLEIFGSLSGLKMNSEKTKVIWIGRKKHSKDKIQTPMEYHNI